jgi:phospholipase C
VFLIVMENHNWAEIKGSPSAPYINGTLLKMGAHAEQYYNPPGVHPSEPNYLWLEAGQDFGVTDDAPPAEHSQTTHNHLVHLLETGGVTWKTYAEDIAGTTCPLRPQGRYVPQHNPVVFFDDVTNSGALQAPDCVSHVRPFPELATDLQAATVAATTCSSRTPATTCTTIRVAPRPTAFATAIAGWPPRCRRCLAQPPTGTAAWS